MAYKRKDGRKADEMRPITIQAGILEKAQGSALVKMGRTHALASVYGPTELHPRFLQKSNQAVLKCRYNMAPFSTEERIRPGFSRRSLEISKVMRESLEPSIFLNEFPRTAIEIQVEILQADAGTRTAAINAAAVALADAGIPMKGLVASVSAGMIEGEYTLDLAGKEEEITACDLPIAYCPRDKRVTLLQMDGNMSKTDVMKTIELAIKGCEQIHKLQREALEKAWIKED